MSYDGILIIYKEKGYTSNDVVSVLRGILKMKKIGHTGTLDPEATGVLPVCLGKATKTVGLLTEKDKEYSAVARLGVTTDTEDMTGKVLSEKDLPEGLEPGFEAVKDAFLSFKGKYEQIPPMYSAKKVNGRKLYELAREGVTIERKPCTVEIKDIVIKSYDYPFVSFDVSCGKGTYIRSLIRDAGEKLGIGAAMESLERTRVSEYSLKEALTLKQVEELVPEGKIGSHILSTESVFSFLPSITVRGKSEGLLKNGNVFSVPESLKNGEYRVHFSDGAFAAVYSIKNGQAKPVKMFL